MYEFVYPNEFPVDDLKGWEFGREFGKAWWWKKGRWFEWDGREWRLLNSVKAQPYLNDHRTLLEDRV